MRISDWSSDVCSSDLDLDPADAERAMLFFSSQASLLIDTTKLVEDAGAEFPALVTIRYSNSIPAYMATALEWDFLRMLPDEAVISRDGWDIFCAYDAIQNGKAVDEADDLPPFDYPALTTGRKSTRLNSRH